MAKNKPKYRGKPIDKIVNKVSGEIGDARLNALLDPDQEVVLVITGKVGAIRSATTGDGLVVTQTIKSGMGYIVADELDGVDLLHQLHAKRNEELDALLGTSSSGSGAFGDDGGGDES